MQALDHATYEDLRQGASVLEADRFGDKVLRLADGNFLKLFRRKRLISSALFYPYAQRFADNARTLRRRGVPCPEIIGVYRVPSIERDVVHYQPLPGQTLRQLIASDQDKPTLRGDLGALISAMHNNGIYFRSLHLGNVVETPEGTLGLIDISDMRTQARPLGKQQRQRNFRHLLRYAQDRDWLLGDDGAAFVRQYVQGSPTLWEPDSLTQLLHQDV
ncbi:lipopolysaccharide kinase InaA family protein [Pseudomonas sp. LA21]|uniref:lipopolysaccharide kinase InaA family protein n=1 Tax=unclassified Pseudomonas TaxID=196821 RepID=UPI001FB6EC22|nr:lipopolysaccharide kinase InaA family protein [Pseudomonas sp. LA21]MCJ1883592.1 lipopolysaccharide kinase InaA family protein [Pseudomonas sp. LA21]